MITTEGNNRAALRVPVADASGEVVKSRFLGNSRTLTERDCDVQMQNLRSNDR